MEKQTDNTNPSVNQDVSPLGELAVFLLVVLLVIPVWILTFGDGVALEKWSWKSYFDGQWQKQVARNAGAGSDAAELLLLAQNQIDFSLYRKLHVQQMVYGKQNHYFTYAELQAYYGLRFPDNDSIQLQIDKLSVICDSLNRRGVKLLFVLGTGKSQIMPENMPCAINNPVKSENGLDSFRKKLARSGIPHIDCIPWLRQVRKQGKDEIYPPFGVHLTYHTDCMLIDSTVKRVSELLERKLRKPIFYGMKPHSDARFRDEELLVKGKIIFAPSYPVWLTSPDSIGFTRNKDEKTARVLGIGDSYYLNFIFTGVTADVFQNGEHWYYFNSIRPSRSPSVEVWELDLKAELERNECIVLVYNPAGLHINLGRFVDETYLMYTDPARYEREVKQKNRIRAEVKLIRKDSKLMGELISRAVKQHKSLEEVLSEEARKRLDAKSKTALPEK
ncbi:MAG: hypothetical protein IM638_15445 [Bacteroidetes bacterium]|nr:hypothetical protein [Bacteroidota bacterium]